MRGFVLPDAFGNALGNSIVSGMAGKGTPQQKQRDEKRVDELVGAGVSPGKAVQMVAEEYYGSVRGDSGASAGDSSVLHGSVNKDQQYASDELVLGNGSERARFYTGGVSTHDDANKVLGIIRCKHCGHPPVPLVQSCVPKTDKSALKHVRFLFVKTFQNGSCAD